MAPVSLVTSSILCSLMFSHGLAFAQEPQKDRQTTNLERATAESTSASALIVPERWTLEFAEGSAAVSRPRGRHDEISRTRISQAPEQDSHWGFSFSYVPVWSHISAFDEVWEATPVDMEGSEFRVGIVRGRDMGGYWGVSFVSKMIKDGSIIAEEDFDFGGGTVPGDFAVFNGVSIAGVEWEGFKPFVTIRDRVQIGLGWGAGVGWFQGTVEVHEFELEFVGPGNAVVITETIEEALAKETYRISVMPLARIELAAAVILAPGLKLLASGGFNFPATQIISVSVSYIFGAS